jgi:hypothetical protein
MVASCTLCDFGGCWVLQNHVLQNSLTTKLKLELLLFPRFLLLLHQFHRSANAKLLLQRLSRLDQAL